MSKKKKKKKQGCKQHSTAPSLSACQLSFPTSRTGNKIMHSVIYKAETFGIVTESTFGNGNACIQFNLCSQSSQQLLKMNEIM